MRLMIASDIHGSTCYCRAMLAAYEREMPDRLLLLGDLLYHGPRNGLPEEYDPKEVLAMLNGIADHLLCVRGNCDTEVDQMVLDFPIMAEYCILWLDKGEDQSSGRMVFATHGHHYHKAALPRLFPGDILLHGHTHIPAWERIPLQDRTAGAEIYYFNPGSVSLPKGGSEHSYMMLEWDPVHGFAAVWKTLEGTVYHREIFEETLMTKQNRDEQ